MQTKNKTVRDCIQFHFRCKPFKFNDIVKITGIKYDIVKKYVNDLKKSNVVKFIRKEGKQSLYMLNAA